MYKSIDKANKIKKKLKSKTQKNIEFCRIKNLIEIPIENILCFIKTNTKKSIFCLYLIRNSICINMSMYIHPIVCLKKYDEHKFYICVKDNTKFGNKVPWPSSPSYHEKLLNLSNNKK